MWQIKIVSAPFAIIGSIGVVAQIPNIHRLLKKHDVDVDVMTAGEYKRTVTMLGENTEKGKQKFQQELEEPTSIQTICFAKSTALGCRTSGNR